MKKTLLILFFSIFFNSIAYTEVVNCNEYKKFSFKYMKCKTNNAKNKTLNVSKNFIDETVRFQKKEWSNKKNEND